MEDEPAVQLSQPASQPARSGEHTVVCSQPAHLAASFFGCCVTVVRSWGKAREERGECFK